MKIFGDIYRMKSSSLRFGIYELPEVVITPSEDPTYWCSRCRKYVSIGEICSCWNGEDDEDSDYDDENHGGGSSGGNSGNVSMIMVESAFKTSII